MLRSTIEIKLNDDPDRWYVVACCANVDYKDHMLLRSGELFPAKDAGITEMNRRVMAWFKEKGRMETEEKVEWRVP